MQKIELFHGRNELEQNIENGYYKAENHMVHPNRLSDNDFLEIEENVKNSFRGTYNEIMTEVEKQKKKAERAYKAQKKKYNDFQEKLFDELKEDLAVLFGVENNDKVHMLFEKASRYSDTQLDLVDNFAYLVELIIPERVLKINGVINE
jgi:hypothetical protein